MSTILKALRRLENDKQAEAARERSHDPLAPALAASEPTPAAPARRPWVSGLAVAAVAAAVGAGASYGLASWWMARDTEPGSLDVASASPQAADAPLAAVPRNESQARAGALAAPSVEPAAAGPPRSSGAGRPQAVQVPGAASGVGSPSPSGSVLAQAAATSPDPWEPRAQAVPSPEASETDTTPAERVTAADATESASIAASKRASSGASSAASSGASTAASGAAATSTAARRPAVAARPPSQATSRSTAAAESPGSAAQTPMPSRRADAAPRPVEGAVPVSSLPELALPEPTPEVPAESAPPQRSASAVTAPPATKTAAPPSPPPSRPSASTAAADSAGDLGIEVLKTVWHPKPERRSARLRLPDRIEVLEVHQDDVVEGYLVSEITPSSVVLERDGDEFTYRVGR